MNRLAQIAARAKAQETNSVRLVRDGVAEAKALRAKLELEWGQEFFNGPTNFR